MGYAPGGGWTRCVSLRCGSCSPPGMGTATTTMATTATSTPTTTASRRAALATATMASHNRYAGALQPRNDLSSGKPCCCPQHRVQPTTHARTRNFQFQPSTIQSSKLILVAKISRTETFHTTHTACTTCSETLAKANQSSGSHPLKVFGSSGSPSQHSGQ